MPIQPPSELADNLAIATRNNRIRTAEHHAKRTDGPGGMIDQLLTEDDIRTLEGAYGFEMARPPSAGLMPMATYSFARARLAVANGHADSVFSALRTMQQNGEPVSDALLAAVANRRDSSDDDAARAYLAHHRTRDFYA